MAFVYKLTLALLVAALPNVAFADTLNAADTAWMMTASALVLFHVAPRLVAFLCRPCRFEECAVSADAVLHHCLCNVSLVVCSGL